MGSLYRDSLYRDVHSSSLLGWWLDTRDTIDAVRQEVTP